MNALAAAREVLVTVESHVMALSGLARLLETLEVVKERLNPDIKMAGILPAGSMREPAMLRKWSSNSEAASVHSYTTR